jgi:uncharacterized protein (DUF1778 family)
VGFFEREMRPSKSTIFVPLWPSRESVPVITVCLQGLRLVYLRLGATHLWPLTECVKVKLTVACSPSPLRGKWCARLAPRPADSHLAYNCHMETKAARLHLRIAAKDKALFERASSLREESMTEFLVESGRERAERLLADRTRFALNDADWRAFTAALDRPPRALPELARLFARPRPR